MNFLTVKPLWPEKKNFRLSRDDTGEMYIFIHFLTPVTARLKEENVLIQPGGCVFFGMHSVQWFSSDFCSLLHDWFHADYTCGELMDRYRLECDTVYYPDDSDEITRLLTEIEMEYLHKGRHYKALSDSIAENLFIKISRGGKEPKNGTADYLQKEIFTKARTRIHMNPDKNWSVEEMAQLVNLSASRFFYVYKKIFGISPQKDLARKRIQMAQTLLIQSGITVEKAAELTGYNNQYHFIRQFKQMTGITPGRYKQAAIKNIDAEEISL